MPTPIVTDSVLRFPIPEGYAVEHVWESKPAALIEELVGFWLEHKALPSQEAAAKRAPEVAAIVRDAGGALAAISTVYQKLHPRFGATFHFYRCFVAPAHRRAGLAALLVFEVASYFQERFKEGHDPQVIGVFLEIENDALQRTMNQAVWPVLPFVYAGKNQRGAHERVFFFEGARL